ncbi:hypothetical protein RJT34_19057 [Clitoria ternatea]|uniref:non-specific serine/threonine protein kinase n=1 Tax=Clitoria ternatea TaxID=43366 RepID=A0AAN9P347_CLITE
MFAIDNVGGYNFCPYAHNFVITDSRRIELEKEVFEDCDRGGVDSPHQSHELAATCTSLRTRFHWGKFSKIWKQNSIKHLPSSPSPISVSNTRSESKSIEENPVLSNLGMSFVTFSLSDLKHATNNFSNDNLIGRGGYAEVYKGKLKDGQSIAVKRMIKGDEDDRTSSFLCELGILANVDHPNSVKLIGCCVEGNMHLVLQLSPLGSLGSLLHGPRKHVLDWSKRYKIITGIADGLLYLHENCLKRIVHRDVKSDNILLAEDFEPKICDFGLAKWLPEQCTHHNVLKFEGTFGYVAPEYLMHGIVNEKTDVYAFGVLLLEIITGRPALDRSQESIVKWAKPLFDANDIKGLVDPYLGDGYDPQQMDRVVLTASVCVDQYPLLRPSMSQVAILLRGDEFLLESAKEYPEDSLLRAFLMESLDA